MCSRTTFLAAGGSCSGCSARHNWSPRRQHAPIRCSSPASSALRRLRSPPASTGRRAIRSEEHTSELQSRLHLVCRLLLEKKKKKRQPHSATSSPRGAHQQRSHPPLDRVLGTH